MNSLDGRGRHYLLLVESSVSRSLSVEILKSFGHRHSMSRLADETVTESLG
jgi:hypothetical protein